MFSESFYLAVALSGIIFIIWYLGKFSIFDAYLVDEISKIRKDIVSAEHNYHNGTESVKKSENYLEDTKKSHRKTIDTVKKDLDQEKNCQLALFDKRAAQQIEDFRKFLECQNIDNINIMQEQLIEKTCSIIQKKIQQEGIPLNLILVLLRKEKLNFKA